MKKRNREERLENNMVEVVDRIMKAQEVSDGKFALVEEKRMRLEEKLHRVKKGRDNKTENFR